MGGHPSVNGEAGGCAEHHVAEQAGVVFHQSAGEIAAGDLLVHGIRFDVLDPAFAPATGTPAPGGFAPIDLLRVVRQIVLDTNVVAMDVMEVAPAYDHADVTVNNAHGLIWEALGAMAHKNKQAGLAG